jgi:molybdate transport system substrate-binding protein
MKLMSTNGVAGVLRELLPGFEQSTGAKVELVLDSSNGLLGRIAAGETADVAILTAEAIDDLTRQGKIAGGSRTDLARSAVGIAVRAGAPKPDIGSVEAFRRTLLAAKSIAYSKAGASGIYFADLIKRMGIADQVNAKATVIPRGFTGELAAKGEVEIAVQQISELMAVPGVDIVGPLPPDIQGVTTFAAGLFSGAKEKDAAAALIRLLSAPTSVPIFKAKGLEPEPDRGPRSGA